MARSRNIKPAFFTNDELSEIDPLGRILFIGMWTIADYKGDFEWREKRVKAQILPYDNCDVKKLAINLDKSGFIRFYSDGNKIYAHVDNFSKHQNPHKNEREKGSDIPSFEESLTQAVDLEGLTINRDKSGLKPDDSASDPADSCSLIPDSCSLIPESEEKPKAKRFSQPSQEDVGVYFLERGHQSAMQEAENFIDFYSAKGWMIGKNKMKCWKAAVRNWMKNDKNFGDGNAKNSGRDRTSTYDIENTDW